MLWSHNGSNILFTINVQWVPGHNDIPGNCQTDELARAGKTLQLDSEEREIYVFGNL